MYWLLRVLLQSYSPNLNSVNIDWCYICNIADKFCYSCIVKWTEVVAGKQPIVPSSVKCPLCKVAYSLFSCSLTKICQVYLTWLLFLRLWTMLLWRSQLPIFFEQFILTSVYFSSREIVCVSPLEKSNVYYAWLENIWWMIWGSIYCFAVLGIHFSRQINLWLWAMILSKLRQF